MGAPLGRVVFMVELKVAETVACFGLSRAFCLNALLICGDAVAKASAEPSSASDEEALT